MNISDATPFLKGSCYNLFADDHRSGFIDQLKQLNDVRVAHPNTTVTGRGADLVLMLGPVDINESVAGVGVMVVNAIKPENSRHHQIVGGGQRILRPKRDPAAKDCSMGHVAANLLRDSEIARRCLEAAFLGANPETRARDRIRSDSFAIPGYGQLLIADGDIDAGVWT